GHLLVEGDPFLTELAARLFEQLLAAPHLLEAGDHRQQQAHAAVHAGPQDGAQLQLEQVGDLERDADRAPPEKWVLLFPETEIARVLVSAEIERAQRDALRPERVDNPAVEAQLFLFVGEIAISEKRKLRTVEADSLGPVAMSKGQVSHETDVRFQRDSPPV